MCDVFGVGGGRGFGGGFWCGGGVVLVLGGSDLFWILLSYEGEWQSEVLKVRKTCRFLHISGETTRKRFLPFSLSLSLSLSS